MINDRAYNILKRLYPNIVHDSVNLKNKYPNHQITYGEMTYEGIESFLLINQDNKIKYFMDIGSGRGKLCIYMALQPYIKKSIGIELVKERHDEAIKLLNNFNKEKHLTNIELLNNDIFDLDLKNMIQEPILIWWSNLCFSDEICDKIVVKLLNEIPKDSIIVCTKKLQQNSKLKQLETKSVSMTWNQKDKVCVYKFI